MRDALYEGKDVPQELAREVGVVPPKGNAPPGASGVPTPAGGWRPLTFADRDAAQAWLESIDAEVRRERGLRVVRTVQGSEAVYWIVRRDSAPTDVPPNQNQSVRNTSAPKRQAPAWATWPTD